MNPYHADLRIESICDIEEFEKTPLSERGLPSNTYALLRASCEQHADKVAIHYIANADDFRTPQSVSYSQLLEKIHQNANFFASLRVGPNEAVAILLPNIPEMQYVLWGMSPVGVVSPLNWMLDEEVLIGLLERSGASTVVTLGPEVNYRIWDKIEAIRPHLTKVRNFVAVMPGRQAPVGWLHYATEIGAQEASKLNFEYRPSSEAIAAYFHTGGTTGVPKLAAQTHANQVFNAWISALVSGLQADDVRVCSIPLFHVSGVLTQSLTPLARGATLVLLTAMGWRDPSVFRNIWSVVEHYRVSGLMLVPSVLNTLLNIPATGKDIGSLNYIGSGTAPLSLHVLRAFEQHFGVGVVEGYGMTEGGALSASNPIHGERRVGSIGLRYPYQEMVVLSYDGKERMPVNQAGVLAIRGPNVFNGYLQGEGVSGEAVVDGWFNTGDLGFQDEAGYFWITGRAKDLIIRGGHNLDPRMIEEALHRHPGVAEVAAVGRPDAHAGELPVAYIKKRPGFDLDMHELRFFAYETIPERAAVPKGFYLVDEIPKTAVGKVRKNILREDAAKRAFQTMVRAAYPELAHEVNVQTHAGDRLQVQVVVSAEASPSAEAVLEHLHQMFNPMSVQWQLELRTPATAASAAIT